MIRQIRFFFLWIADDLDDFVRTNAILFRIFKGAYQRFQKGDPWFCAFMISCEEEERRMDEELEQLLEERKNIVRRREPIIGFKKHNNPKCYDLFTGEEINIGETKHED